MKIFGTAPTCTWINRPANIVLTVETTIFAVISSCLHLVRGSTTLKLNMLILVIAGRVIKKLLLFVDTLFGTQNRFGGKIAKKRTQKETLIIIERR